MPELSHRRFLKNDEHDRENYRRLWRSTRRIAMRYAREFAAAPAAEKRGYSCQQREIVERAAQMGFKKSLMRSLFYAFRKRDARAVKIALRRLRQEIGL